MLTSQPPNLKLGLSQPFTISPSDFLKTREAQKSVATPLVAMTNWQARMDFWKDEYYAFNRIVDLHLNENPKHDLARRQNFIPLKIAIEKELTHYEVELAYIHNFMLQEELGDRLAMDLYAKWSSLERQLIEFEKAHHVRKKRFLAMLLKKLPLKIH